MANISLSFSTSEIITVVAAIALGYVAKIAIDNRCSLGVKSSNSDYSLELDIIQPVSNQINNPKTNISGTHITSNDVDKLDNSSPTNES